MQLESLRKCKEKRVSAQRRWDGDDHRKDHKGDEKQKKRTLQLYTFSSPLGEMNRY